MWKQFQVGARVSTALFFRGILACEHRVELSLTLRDAPARRRFAAKLQGAGRPEIEFTNPNGLS